MAEATANPETLEQVRDRVLRLAELQLELRRLLNEYIGRTGKNFTDIAASSGCSWTSVSRFVRGETILSTPAGLGGLGRMLGCGSLTDEIILIAQPLPDRILGLANGSPEAIRAAFDLKSFYQQWADSGQVKTAQFAQAFGKNRMVVASVLANAREGVAALERQAVREQIEAVLLDGLESGLASVQTLEAAEKQACIKRLEQAIAPLRARHGTQSAIEKDLELKRNTLTRALKGHFSTEKIIQLTGQLQKAERSKAAAECAYPTGSKPSRPDRADPAPAPAPAPTPAPAPQPAPTPTPLPAPPPAEPAPAQPFAARLAPGLLAAGGSTTKTGIPFVLQRADFKPLPGLPLIELRDGLLRSIRLTRLMLNIGAQFDDPEGRAVLKTAIGRELEELDMAMKAFTFVHPNEMLGLNEAQRDHWKEKSESIRPTSHPKHTKPERRP